MTRTVPDAELDDCVGAVAARIAAFDSRAIAGAKVHVNRATLPPEADLLASSAEFSQAVTWPQFQAGQSAIGKLAAEFGVEEFERNLGDYLGVAAGRS